MYIHCVHITQFLQNITVHQDGNTNSGRIYYRFGYYIIEVGYQNLIMLHMFQHDS